MKKLVFVVAAILTIAVFLIGAASVPMQAPVRAVTEEFVSNQVDLYMPSNPTTGYSWAYDIGDAEVIAVKDRFFEDSSTLGNVVGEGGTHWFHIAGLKPGTTSVTFRYLRPWEPDSALSQTTYRLTVDESLNVLIWGVESFGP